MRHRTAVPHRSYHLRYMLEWSLSGHCSVCINHSAQNFKGWLRKTLNRRHFYLSQYLSYKLQVLNLHGFRRRFWLCPSIYILKINGKKNLCWYWDPPLETGSLPHQTAANQIVPKIFLDPDLTECRWGTPILGISTLWWIHKTDLSI